MALRVYLLVCWIAGAHALGADLVGSFSSARSGIRDVFDMFDPDSYMAPGIADLAGDGHQLVNLDQGITEDSLSGLATVYLPVAAPGQRQILSSPEVTALQAFVAGGGNLIVQGDVFEISWPYHNVALAFGVDYVGDGSQGFRRYDLTGLYEPLTDGPYGTVRSMWTAYSGALDPLQSTGVSLLDWTVGEGLSGLYVLPPSPGSNSGTVIFHEDVNTFATNYDGYGEEERALWRNMFAIPAPATVLVAPALLVMVCQRRRTCNRLPPGRL